MLTQDVSWVSISTIMSKNYFLNHSTIPIVFVLYMVVDAFEYHLLKYMLKGISIVSFIQQ